MNSNNTPAIIRSLIIYAICIPVAAWIGYLLASESWVMPSGGSWGWNVLSLVKANPIPWIIFVLLMSAPLLLRWHHFLMIAGWNFGLTVFFLPGSPPFWLLLVALSFGISVLNRTVNSRAHFLSAPEIARPLIFFLAVIILTAKLTGGIGLHSLGNEVSGGRRYFTIIFGILCYFAFTAQQIPPQRVRLYVSLFFLAGFCNFIGDLASYLPSSLSFVSALFPGSGYGTEDQPGAMGFHPRYAGLGSAGMAGFLFVISRYGARGILLSGQPWRWLLFGLTFLCMLFGGFRSSAIFCALTFAIQFFLERIHRTRAMPFIVLGGLLLVMLMIPFASHLPWSVQRSLAFLPLKIDPVARMDAQGSEDWRLEIWRDTYPEVPKYLLLGKGYAISQEDLATASNANFRYLSQADTVATAQNYHSGPLSVLMPFGAWGAIALLWFWFASLRALHDNYRYGNPAFQTINIFLFSYFIAKIFIFLVIFGGIEGDMASFAVIIGLSISINGRIRRPAPAQLPVVDKTGTTPLSRPRFQPFYQR